MWTLQLLPIFFRHSSSRHDPTLIIISYIHLPFHLCHVLLKAFSILFLLIACFFHAVLLFSRFASIHLSLCKNAINILSKQYIIQRTSVISFTVILCNSLYSLISFVCCLTWIEALPTCRLYTFLLKLPCLVPGDPSIVQNGTMDPFKTLFVARIVSIGSMFNVCVSSILFYPAAKRGVASWAWPLCFFLCGEKVYDSDDSYIIVYDCNYMSEWNMTGTYQDISFTISCPSCNYVPLRAFVWRSVSCVCFLRTMTHRSRNSGENSRSAVPLKRSVDIVHRRRFLFRCHVPALVRWPTTNTSWLHFVWRPLPRNPSSCRKRFKSCNVDSEYKYVLMVCMSLDQVFHGGL